jgi:hypothetical protein
MNDAQTQALFKLLFVLFSFSVGICFTFWPRQVNRIFRRGRGLDPDPGEADLTPAHRQHQSVMLALIRQLGVLLLGLSVYALYFWLRPR